MGTKGLSGRNLFRNDTVVARATADGEAGLAVVRISGPEALAVAGRVFRGEGFPGRPESHRAVYGILAAPGCGPGGEKTQELIIDQALALPMLAPRSFTGEDTVEFFCHGGRVVTQSVVEACCRAGAVPAPPGEFTRRAFLNGKLSLDQAEAVADLIHAPASLAAKAAVRQLLGGMDEQMRRIEDPLLDLLVRIEGSLEFADEEDVSVPVDRVRRILEKSRDRIGSLLDVAPAGRLLREGVHVVLAGPPNVGKSTLFNALLGEERAIVDSEAGTTRDVVIARVVRSGTAFVLHDTAGLREDAGRVERKGIERTHATLASADLVLSLWECGDPQGPDTGAISRESGVPVIPVLTKCDLQEGTGLSEACLPPGTQVTCGRDGRGLDGLWRAMEDVVAGYRLDAALSLGVIMNDRHRYKLEQCRGDLALLIADLEKQAPGAEVTGTMLAGIMAGLGEVSGRVFTEQLLDSVFRRFCVGK